MSRQITIYQVFSYFDPAETDVFLPTLREARAMSAQLEADMTLVESGYMPTKSSTSIIKHKVTLTGRGVCLALTNWPMR